MADGTNPATATATEATAAAPTETSTETTAPEGAQDTSTQVEGQEGDATAAPSEGSEVNSAGDEPPAEHQEFVIEPPEEFAAFGDEFKAFSAQMDGWLKDNPDATARDALQEAAMRQARSVSEAAEAHQAQTQEWLDAAKKDPAFGGAKFDENVASVLKTLDTFDQGGEARAILDQSGLGNHPAILKLLHNAGRSLQEPGVVTGATSNKPRSFADSLYGKKD